MGGTLLNDAFWYSFHCRFTADAERVFRKLGISSSEAINLFYSQVRLRKGLPFPLGIPNAVTRQTFEKTDRGEDLHDYPSLDDFLKKKKKGLRFPVTP